MIGFRMINPRAGHGPAFGIEILYAMAAMIIGWPVAIPAMYVELFLSEHFNIKIPVAIFWIGCAVGAYVHYKMWAFLIGALRAWWNNA